MEHRSYRLEKLEVRENGSQSTISGYAALFNRLSSILWGFREKIAPWAFADSLKDDIRAFWQHDSAQVLGRTKAGTLSVWEDERGLGFDLTPPDTQTGRDAVTLIGRGDVDQMSFGFNVLPDGDSWEQTGDGMLIRTLHKVRLIEISPVTFPAYPDTSVAVRSEDVDIASSAPEWVQRALAQGVDHKSGAADVARARLLLRQRQHAILNLRR